MDPAVSHALTPLIEQRSTDIDGRFNPFSTRMDEMFGRSLLATMIRLGRMLCAETAAIMAVLHLMPRP